MSGINDAKRFAVVGLAVLCLYSFSRAAQPLRESAEEKHPAAAANELVAASPPDYQISIIRAPASVSQEWQETVFVPSHADEAVETRISGSAALKNETSYDVDVSGVIAAGTRLKLPSDGPQILIIHTHSSEAYTPAGLDRYVESDSARTEDSEHNIIRVGDELARLFEQAGLRVIHDRGVYDYPSYTGSYSRSGAAVERYLSEYPGISVVLDVHRDALGSDDVIYKTVAEEQGTCASQAMLLVGTDESGLYHPAWRENLSLALYLQNAVSGAHPTLMRPVALVPQRYNQQLSTGMLILEVGSSGNTMQEALAAVRLFAEAAAPALLSLVDTAGQGGDY